MSQQLNRRKFMRILGSASAAINLGTMAQSPAQSTTRPAVALPATPGRNISLNATVNRKNVVATQVKAYAWQDEGIDYLLDNLQHKGNINTVFAFTFLPGSGRIEKGGPIMLPDHGKYGEADEGGAYYDADPKYFQETTLRGGHSPDKFKMSSPK